MAKQLSPKGKILVFLYFFISFALVIYFDRQDFPKLPYREITSILVGLSVATIFELIVIKWNRLRILYENFVVRLIWPIKTKVKMDLKSYDKIKDKDLRNLMIKSYIDSVFEDARSDVGTKIIMIINLIIIGLNLIFLLAFSYLSNFNPIFILLFEERIKEIGVQNVAQELGINYADLPKTYIESFLEQYDLFFKMVPMAFISCICIFFFGSIFYFFIESTKRARLRSINEVLVELYKKDHKIKKHIKKK